MKRAVAAVVILAIIVIAWLILAGSDDSKNTTQTGTQTPKTQTPAVNNSPDEDSNISNAVAVQQVKIADMAFSPAQITIKKGTKVTWTNSDSVSHDVKENDGKNGPSSSTLSPGQSYSFTYNETGTYNYYCSIHPEMTGSVTVTD